MLFKQGLFKIELGLLFQTENTMFFPSPKDKPECANDGQDQYNNNKNGSPLLEEIKSPWHYLKLSLKQISSNIYVRMTHVNWELEPSFDSWRKIVLRN